MYNVIFIDKMIERLDGRELNTFNNKFIAKYYAIIMILDKNERLIENSFIIL
jgi:hypothetical protein